MGIFTRFKDIVNSNINSLLDKAEDPEKMLRLMIQEMEDTIIDMKSSCARDMAEEIRIGKKIKEADEAAERWQQRAEMALDRGREDMAREALIEKRSAKEASERLKSSFASISESVSRGKEEIKTLEEKLSQAKEKLKALQEKEAKIRMEREKNEASMQSRFDEMEDRINRMAAWNDLSRKEDGPESRFQKMERDEAIEEELSRMKREKDR